MISNGLFKKIINDNIHGSSFITNEFINTLKHYVTINKVIDKNELILLIQIIFNTFPNFTLLFHFLNELSLFIENYGEKIESQIIIEFIHEYENKWKGSKEKAASTFLKEIPIENKNILLHSNSGAIQTLITKAKIEGFNFEVWQTVSSPANEGIIQAEKLADSGIKVNLIHENEIFLLKNYFDFAILGTDFLCEDFFINKTGSNCISKLKIPVYLISESRKFICKTATDKNLFNMITHENNKPAKELYNNNNPNIEIFNYYFEKVPITKINKIVMENTVLAPDSLPSLCQKNNKSISNYFL